MSTTIILTATVENLGVQGDTVKVAEGYARNYLIPRGLGIVASTANLRRIETLRKRHETEMAAKLEAAQILVKQLVKQEYTITAAAGPDKKLFGSVTAANIADVLAAKKLDVDRKKIVLEKPIHELGTFEVEIKLHPEVSAKIQVHVVTGTSGGAPASGSTRRSARKE